jgi:hypothetical protein
MLHYPGRLTLETNGQTRNARLAPEADAKDISWPLTSSMGIGI